MKKIEVWKTIEEYPNYMISNMGNVKSLNYGKERILKQVICKNGYCKVSLCEQGKMKTFSVHRLVCTAFIPNPNNYPCVNHLNEDKTDNRVENLMWCTQAYNNTYGTRLVKVSNTMKGRKFTIEHNEKMGESHRKPIVQIHQNGLIIGVYDSTKEAGNELGIYRGNITNCLKGKRKSAGGFKFKYLNELKKAG